MQGQTALVHNSLFEFCTGLIKKPYSLGVKHLPVLCLYFGGGVQIVIFPSHESSWPLSNSGRIKKYYQYISKKSKYNKIHHISYLYMKQIWCVWKLSKEESHYSLNSLWHDRTKLNCHYARMSWYIFAYVRNKIWLVHQSKHFIGQKTLQLRARVVLPVIEKTVWE